MCKETENNMPEMPVTEAREPDDSVPTRFVTTQSLPPTPFLPHTPFLPPTPFLPHAPYLPHTMSLPSTLPSPQHAVVEVWLEDHTNPRGRSSPIPSCSTITDMSRQTDPPRHPTHLPPTNSTNNWYQGQISEEQRESSGPPLTSPVDRPAAPGASRPTSIRRPSNLRRHSHLRRRAHVPRWAYELEGRNIAAQERLASAVEAVGVSNAAAQERLIAAGASTVAAQERLAAAQERLAAAMEAIARLKCCCAQGQSGCRRRST